MNKTKIEWCDYTMKSLLILLALLSGGCYNPNNSSTKEDGHWIGFEVITEKEYLDKVTNE